MQLGLDTAITLLAAGLVFLGALCWGVWKAATVAVFFFVVAIGTYPVHGARRDTTNQCEHTDAGLRAGMAALIAGEIGGFAAIFTGFVAGQFF